MRILKTLYPFLFALSPALFLYAFNIEEVDAGALIIPIAASLALTALIGLAAGALVRDRLKAGLITFLAAFALLSFGHFLNLVRETLFKNPKLSYLPPLVVWILLFVGFGALVVRTRRDLGPLVMMLSTFVLLLIVLSLAQIGFFYLRTPRSEVRDTSLPAEIKALKAGAPPRDQLPDIYYLIFDRYGNQEILKAYFGYDNSSFAEFLVRRGFYVASQSHCNYPGTFLSLTSSLNMDYLNGLVVNGAVHKQVILGMLQDFKVWRLLKPLGYRYLHLGSWYEPTQSNPNADLNFGGSGLLGFSREFLLKFIEETVFNPLAKGSLMFPKARQSVLEKFELLTRIPEMPGPKFVFMHMLLPHHPFVFAPDGRLPDRDMAATRSQGEKYVDQVIFANTRIRKVVAAILAKSKRPPIIILQADEGPGDEEKPVAYLQSVGSKERMALTTRIRCGILNAYYLPGVATSALYPTITPVNTFRLVFNLYFGGHYPLLEDKTYHASQDKTTVLDFRLVPADQLAVPAAKRL